MGAFLSLKSANVAIDAYSIINDSKFGGPLSYIKLCLKAATLLQDYTTALRGVVSEKEKEDMLQNVNLLQINLQKLAQLQQNLNEEEIRRLYTQLEQAKNQLTDLSEHAKKHRMAKMWYHIWYSTSMKDKFTSIKTEVNLVVQKSTLLVTTLNLELTASLLLELRKMKSEVGTLKKKISKHNALILKVNAVYVVIIIIIIAIAFIVYI